MSAFSPDKSFLFSSNIFFADNDTLQIIKHQVQVRICFDQFSDFCIFDEDLTDILPYINVETLLVFGEYDEMTPVEKGRQMEKLMPDAALVVFEKDDHFAYINEAARFNLVLDAFLRRGYQ